MLKEYIWMGGTWQFEESQAPKDALPVEMAISEAPVSELDNQENQPLKKSSIPRNKARSVKNKDETHE